MTLKVRILAFSTTFTQLTARIKNFLVGWLLFLGLKEGLVECALVCVKSWVILTYTPAEAKIICDKNEWLVHTLSMNQLGTGLLEDCPASKWPTLLGFAIKVLIFFSQIENSVISQRLPIIYLGSFYFLQMLFKVLWLKSLTSKKFPTFSFFFFLISISKDKVRQ